MTPAEAKSHGYTHLGSFYGLPVYLHRDGEKIAGRWELIHLILPAWLWVFQTAYNNLGYLMYGPDFEPPFPIVVKGKI